MHEEMPVDPAAPSGDRSHPPRRNVFSKKLYQRIVTAGVRQTKRAFETGRYHDILSDTKQWKTRGHEYGLSEPLRI